MKTNVRPAKKAIAVLIDAELHSRLLEICASEDRPISNYVRLLITNDLEKREQANG